VRHLTVLVNNNRGFTVISDSLRRLVQRHGIIPASVDDDYLPIQEAAKLYRTSDDTLYKLIAAGKLKRYRREMDRKTWVKRSELDKVFRPKPS
jgi:excisionase family DNA binding protein